MNWRPQRAPLPHPPRKNTRVLSPNHAGTLIRLPASRFVRNEFLLFGSHQCIVFCYSSQDGLRPTVDTKHNHTHKNGDQSHSYDIWTPASETAVTGKLNSCGIFWARECLVPSQDKVWSHTWKSGAACRTDSPGEEDCQKLPCSPMSTDQ